MFQPQREVTYWCEGCGLVYPRGVIHCDASVVPSVSFIGDLWDTPVSAIACFEGDIGRPVRRKVLVEVAGRASREFCNVGIGHRCSKGILSSVSQVLVDEKP